MPTNEETGTYTNLNGEEVQVRYLLNPVIVKARRLSDTEWEIQGPWPEPFVVDEQSFRQEFIEL